jgi:hypothetical protein
LDESRSRDSLSTSDACSGTGGPHPEATKAKISTPATVGVKALKAHFLDISFLL